MTNNEKTKRKIKWLIWFFISMLVLCGITAFPLETELGIIRKILGNSDSGISLWIARVHEGLKATNEQFPFLAYGTDWMAFAHLVIAVVFIGPLKDPVRNIWVIEFGIIACLMVFPLAFIAGSLRGIPIYWQMIDCSFGVFGLITLVYCRNLIKNLEQAEKEITLNY
jgi:hypothetical protein